MADAGGRDARNEICPGTSDEQEASMEIRSSPQQGLGADVVRREAITPDADIVKRVQAGDRDLFEVLMRRHNQRVYRTIRSILRDESEVEDAMQQTYLLAYAHLGEFAGASSFATWLTRIAVNEALGRLRKRVHLVPVDEHPEAAEDGPMPRSRSETPEESAANREAVRILERAVDRMAPAYRMVVMLRDVEQLSTAETAEALGLTEEAVRIRLHRARLSLRETYADDVRRGGAEAFPFHAPRCDRVVAAVMAAISSDRP
jgi:RNA polymerase sigma-70 factor (ECF subfamily)